MVAYLLRVSRLAEQPSNWTQSLGYSESWPLLVATPFLLTRCSLCYVAVKQISVSDKVKTRLEQLDDFEDGSVREMLNLSQQDYVKRIDELNKALITAWSQDQRVKALKIAIQVKDSGLNYLLQHTV